MVCEVRELRWSARTGMRGCAFLFVVLFFCLAIVPCLGSQPTPYIRTNGTISYLEEKPMIGVNVLHEPYLWHPDLWTLVKRTGVNVIRFWDDWLPPSYERWRKFADEAALNGVKVMYVITGSIRPEAGDIDLLKARIDGFNVEELQGHPGVWGYDICNEPSALQLQSKIPQQGAEYIKQKDPTHLTTVGLASRYPELTYGEEVNLVVDYVDVISVHTYRVKDFQEGKNMTEIFNNFLRTEVIPYSKGKSVYLTECGLWTEKGTDFGVTATFTEDDQANYFTQVFEACLENNVLMFAWKLVDNVARDSLTKAHYGIYRMETENGENIPKKSVATIKNLST